MCGLAGVFRRAEVAPAIPAAMLAALARRGPDARHARALARGGESLPDSAPAPAWLLHARLSIIDPRPAADQPMASDDGRVWIVYNGESYGWQDDAAGLARQRPFRTRSDTEFLLRAYEAWGIDGLLTRQRGMFALAIVDFGRRKLYLARDRLGKKPLVYAAGDDGIAFASTLAALKPALPDDARRIDPEALDAYLAHRTIPAPRTLFAGARKLPPGHLLEVDLDTFACRSRAYWTPQPADHGPWTEVLDEAVQLRLVADRPVGIFLSGGIDSAVIASRIAALGDLWPTAFTAAFPGDALDESAAAAETARFLGLRHEVVAVPKSIRDDFSEIVAALDEPFSDPSAIPLWYLARAATKEVKVVLAGDGGDELFAGYKRYRQHLRSRFRRGIRLPFLAPDATPLPTKSQRLGEELALDWDEAYGLRFSGFSPCQRRALLAAPVAPVRWRTPDPLPADPLRRLLAWDYANYLPDYILRKADLATMAHGLELRAPLLDQRLFETVLALPDAKRFTRPPKQALAALLPRALGDTLLAGKKRGFNPPLGHWLKVDLADRVDGLPARLADRTAGLIRPDAVAAVIAAHAAGAGRLAERLLQLLMLDESLALIAAP